MVRMRFMRPPGRAIVLGLTVLLACLAGACGTRQSIRGVETDGLDRKLSTFAFIEEGDLVTFIVDTRATFYREKTPYIPLEITVANKGLRQLRLTRESFTLIDEEGNRYPVASPEELIRGYEFLDLDRNPPLAELRGITDSKFGTYTKYPSQFSPTRMGNAGLTAAGGSTLVRDSISLPRFGVIFDFIYFSQPTTGLKGHRFELFLESPDLEDPVFVKFMVK